MKRKRIFSIVVRLIFLSVILSLFSISFMQKRYDPSGVLLTSLYESKSEDDMKLQFKIQDNRNVTFPLSFYSEMRKSEFSNDLTRFDTYKYVMEASEDNFIPYRFSEVKNRRILKVGEKVNLVAGYMPYSSETYKINNEYGTICHASVLLYEYQIKYDLPANGSYEDVLFQEVIPYTYSIRIGYFDSHHSDYKIAGIIEGNAPNEFELLTSLLPEDMSNINKIEDIENYQITLMNGFKYTLTGNYSKDIKVIRLLFDENPLGDVKFTLMNLNAVYEQCNKDQEKYHNNNIYIYGIILSCIYLVYNFQSNARNIKKEKKEGTISKKTSLLKILKDSYLHSLIYLLIPIFVATLVCLIHYLSNKETILYFDINPIITFIIPIFVWIIYAPINVLVHNEIINS